MILITETEYWFLLIGFFVCLIFSAISILTCKGYIRARIFEILGFGRRTLKKCRDGKLRWGNEKDVCGFLTSPDSHTQIALDRINRTTEGDFFLMTEGFGLTYDVDIASCVAFLEASGFQKIVDALKKYDEEYFDKDKNPENYDNLQKAIAEDNLNKTLKVKEIKKDARTKLLRMDLQWINEWTIPLSVTYRWALQNVDAMNNKNLYDKGVLAAKNDELKGGWTPDKITFFVTMIAGMLIVGAIAFYIFTIAGAQATKNIPPPADTTTTTTLIQTIAQRVIQNATTIPMQ